MNLILFLGQLIIFLLPFERIPSIEIWGVTNRLIIPVILIATIIILFKINYKKIKISLIDKSVILLWLVYLISTIGQYNSSRTWEVFLFFSFALLGYFSISYIFKNHNHELFYKPLLIGLLITVIFGLWQFFGDSIGLSNIFTGLTERYSKIIFGFPRIQSVALEPLYYANYLLLPITFLGVKIVIEKKSSWLNILFYFSLVVFFLTLSRGGFLALGISFIVTLIIFWHHRVKFIKIFPTIYLAFFALMTALFLVFITSNSSGVQDYLNHSITKGEESSESVYGRIDHYNEAIRLWKTSPIIGIGPGQYGLKNEIAKYTELTKYPIVNNQYLETLAETGILGLLAFLFLIYTVLKKLISLNYRKLELWQIVLIGTFGGFLVQYNFFSTIYVIIFWVLIGIINGLKYETK